MSKNYEMNEKQKHYTTEGRDNEYIQQTYDKKDMDNSEQVLYNNDNKYNSNTKTSDTDYAEQWMNKNQGLLRYAGDRAKKSINAGLAEAPSYMKDATEDTSFEKVQDTAVKRSLANDANDTKLYNLTVNEMIGHLSSENKEPYLKDALPLKNYIEAKDEYDFKNNNYTTTENVDTTPNEAVRVLQRELNKGNYTDKFGQKLKEDGIYAGKTAYADDRYREDIDKTNTNSNNYAMFTLEKGKKFNSAPVNNNVYPTTIQELQQKMLNNPEIKFPADDYIKQAKSSTKKSSDTNDNTYYNKNNVLKWREIPSIDKRIPTETKLYNEGKITKELYDAFDFLSQRWYFADTKLARKEISELAQKIRDNGYKYNDCTQEANKQLWENGKAILELNNGVFSIADAGLEWYKLVDNNCDWDYKKVPADWMPEEEYFMFYGQIISLADFGNINYGYTGTVLGLSPETLYKGAGYVQSSKISNDPSNYYGDSEVDYKNVKKGIEWANNKGYKGNIDLPLKILFGILK